MNQDHCWDVLGKWETWHLATALHGVLREAKEDTTHGYGSLLLELALTCLLAGIFTNVKAYRGSKEERLSTQLLNLSKPNLNDLGTKGSAAAGRCSENQSHLLNRSTPGAAGAAPVLCPLWDTAQL